MATYQEIYRQAEESLTKGRAILKEFEGKALPKEKGEEADKFFDECDKKTKEADRLWKAEQLEKELGQPQRKHPMVDGNIDGKAVAPATAADLKAAGEIVASKELLSARRKYLKSENEAFSRLTPEEAKALSSLSDPEGGFILTTQENTTMITKRRDAVKIRQYATVINTTASQVTNPFFNYEPTGIAKVAEGAEKPTEDPTNMWGKITFTPIKIADIVPIPDELIEDAMFNLEEFLTDWFAMIFKEKEEDYFINGTGVNEPLGLLNAGFTTRQAATADKVVGDDLIDVVYDIREAYRSRGVWLMNRSMIRHVRKLKEDDTTGAYLWQPSLQAGQPPTLLGFALLESEYFPAGTPTSTATSPLAIFGDLSYFWIVDRIGFQVKRLTDGEYGKKDLIGVRMRERFDAAPVLKDPFIVLTAK